MCKSFRTAARRRADRTRAEGASALSTRPHARVAKEKKNGEMPIFWKMYINMCASGRCLRYAFCWLLKEEQGGRKRPFSSTSFSKGRHFPCKLYSEAAEAGGARWSWPWPRPEARARRTRPGFASAASLGSVADGLLLGLLRVSVCARAAYEQDARILHTHMQWLWPRSW